MKKGWLMAVAIICIWGFSASCTSTSVKSVWSDPEYKGAGVDEVFVIGISKEEGIRRVFEDSFSDQLKGYGVTGIPSYRSVSNKELMDKDIIQARVKEAGVDAVLLTRVLDIKKETQYYPPRYYYRGYYDYYSRSYPASRGYTVEYETAVVETNLYDTKKDKLIWSARSDASLDGPLDEQIKEYVKIMTEKLAESGLLK